ncbi:MAG: type II secretion system protein [Candidatus Vogelbacteria bacterium]
MLSPSSHFNSRGHAHFRVRAGFTLIEMLVVISIFLIMTGVILANFPAFRDKAALDLLAQEIATTIRQAQVYGIGTREAGSEFTSYGIYFALDTSKGLNNKTFYLYADKDANKNLSPNNPAMCIPASPPGVDCIIEKFTITGTAKIEVLQGCTGNCASPTILPNLGIFFQRFYPEATLPPGYSYVKIVIQSTRDATRKKEIQVWATGQIVVANL